MGLTPVLAHSCHLNPRRACQVLLGAALGAAFCKRKEARDVDADDIDFDEVDPDLEMDEEWQHLGKPCLL